MATQSTNTEKQANTSNKSYNKNDFNILVEVPKIKDPNSVLKRESIIVNLDWIYFYSVGRNRQGQEMFAITKQGLIKLGVLAGFEIGIPTQVDPSGCYKCLRRKLNKDCDTCPENLTMSYVVPISRFDPITGKRMMYYGDKELDRYEIEKALEMEKTKGNSRYLKARKETCVSKALARALRNVLAIKPTYTAEEIRKPFLIMKLSPNLNNPEVKARTLDNMFSDDSDYAKQQEIKQIYEEDIETGVFENNAI